MVKNAFYRLILRFLPELGQRKHLPQLARIEKVYDLPIGTSKISTNFRAYKAADIQLLNAVTGEPLNIPIFEQVTLATGQSSERGLFVEPSVGMRCLIQYIDGLDSMPVITSLLPWNTLVPENSATDVVLQQSSRSKIKGSNGDWLLETDGKIEQISQKSLVKTQIREQEYHQRNTTIESHDTTKIDGNQVNEIMGALKTVIGEKALILALDNIMLGSEKEIQLQSIENMTLESLKTFEAKAAELAKIKGKTVWVGNDSLNVLQVLLDLITIVKDMNTALSTHTHKSAGSGVPIQATAFTGFKSDSSTLHSDLSPITE